VSQINHTLTYFADHKQLWSHDTIRNFLKSDRLRPSAVWKMARGEIVFSEQGFVLFDDSVLDRNYSEMIELVRRQYSGNAKAVIRGIGLVSCIYVNPETGQFWVIDYRIFAPDNDGKSKIDHVLDMLDHTVVHKKLPFTTVLMDSWYAATVIFKRVEKHGKIYYCPIKGDRQIDETGGADAYRRVDSLVWSEEEQKSGKLVHLKTMPKGHRVKLFRVALSTERTDFVVTNDLTQNSTDATKQICGIRWKIEQFFRETKQVTGIECCQCRLQRIQRNHIGCAILLWLQLTKIAAQTKTNVYQLKFGLLKEYMVQMLQKNDLLTAFS